VRRIVLRIGLAAGALALGAATARAEPAATLCVGSGPGCFATVQTAVDAAQSGDTIRIDAGTFDGGVTITKSLRLVGTGAATTRIAGGGPVVTIGAFDGDNAGLTVVLSRLTITGGHNDSQPSTSIVGGGGVWIPGSHGPAVGATVSIDHAVISGNQVDASSAIAPGGFSCPPDSQEPCAFVNGGGIENGGVLTLTDTRVTDNVAGAPPGGSSLASASGGGGISSAPLATLTLRRCRVVGNRSAVTSPDGAFSEGGGVQDGGAMTIEDSTVDGNASVVSSSLASVFPFDVTQNADAGGVDVSPSATGTIRDTSVSGNTVSDADSAGDAEAFNGGIDDDGALVLTGATVEANQVTAEVPPASGFRALALNGGLGVTGSAVLDSTRVSGNRVTGTSATGAADVLGAGIGNNGGQVALTASAVVGNDGTATALGGIAIGGGISNIKQGSARPHLTLTDSVVGGNSLEGTPGVTALGGGIFSANVLRNDPLLPRNLFPVRLVRTVVSGNAPDQCIGRGC
jgi:hypothetical protein